MNILVINGSPKCGNSNTMRLTNAFLDGAGWSDAEIINVSDEGVKGCTGCYICWTKTPGKCVINDGMSSILDKLITADVVIWSFPLYYFSIPGNLKNLIDRQLPTNLPFMTTNNESGGHPSRYDLSRQRHIMISTCGFWTAEGNYDAVEAMFDRCYGAGNYSTILCGQGELFRVPELRNRTDEYLKIVRRAGAEFAAGNIRMETGIELSKPLYPRDVFEKMADASWNITEKDGVTSDGSLNFTTQMAALYRPDGVERVLELCFTDIQKTYQILLTGSGSEVITDGFRRYTTKIETPFSVWSSIAKGEISGQTAYFQRRFKVLGDFDLMLRWDELFGVSVSERPADEKRKRPNMLVLLVPWIIFWVIVPIDPTAGSAAGIMAAASLPLLWLVFRPVVFEQITVPVVIGLSAAILLGTDVRFIVSASYLAFGLIWFTGAFTRTPLSAYYSAAKYGGGRAFDNPLFMRTNRILTAAWGILYLVTPAWTYVIMGTEMSAYIGLINSVCPLIMGVFTVWFQKWYPAQWSRSG
ncbi:MAG: NAD(P)H-dependent oxidoreductase [Methanomassiliicoccaceae archaeon]|nr:NAD(P)H-dependent oxidoreductase [Methanomassiliicoccaceae archaeon]